MKKTSISVSGKKGAVKGLTVTGRGDKVRKVENRADVVLFSIPQDRWTTKLKLYCRRVRSLWMRLKATNLISTLL
jgi:hypothetical protein